MVSHCLTVCHASLTVALQKAMGTLPSDTESFLLHQYLSDCWGLQSFKSVVKTSLLFVPRIHHITDRVKKMACFSDGRNLNLLIAATCKICNTCTILRHNQSERIVRFRRTVRFEGLCVFEGRCFFEERLENQSETLPQRLRSEKKMYVLLKRNGKCFFFAYCTTSDQCKPLSGKQGKVERKKIEKKKKIILMSYRTQKLLFLVCLFAFKF